jgi:hypothetical protein
VVVTSGTDSAKKAVGMVRDYGGASRSVTLVADPDVFTIEEGDSIDVIAGGFALPLWLSRSGP